MGLLLYLLEGFFILTYFLLFLLQLLILPIILILQLPYLPQFLIEAHFHLPLPLLIIPHQPIFFLLLWPQQRVKHFCLFLQFLTHQLIIYFSKILFPLLELGQVWGYLNLESLDGFLVLAVLSLDLAVVEKELFLELLHAGDFWFVKLFHLGDLFLALLFGCLHVAL